MCRLKRLEVWATVVSGVVASTTGYSCFEVASGIRRYVTVWCRIRTSEISRRWMLGFMRLSSVIGEGFSFAVIFFERISLIEYFIVLGARRTDFM